MNTSPSDLPTTDRRQDLIRLALITVGLLVPFMFKPANIDDHLFLLIAQRIREAPFDPFGVGVNWFGWAQPMSKAMFNPPGHSYMLALVTGWGGVVAGHVVGAGWAVAAVLGVYHLAEQLGAPAMPTALVALVTPALFISSTTLMCDVPMTATYTWCVVWWQRGVSTDDRRALWLATAAAIASISLKYFALSLLPLLVGSALVHRAGWRVWLRHIVVIVLSVLLWECFTLMKYDAPHILSATNYSVAPNHGTPLSRAFDACSYVGGCMVGILFLIPVLPRRQVTLPAVVVALAAGLIWYGRGRFAWVPLVDANGFNWSYFVQAVINVAAFAVALFAVVQAVRRAPPFEPKTMTALAWILGTLVFAIGVNWHVAARAVLPLVPPAIALILRVCAASPRALLFAVVPGALHTLVAVDGDVRIANAQVDAADAALKLAPPERLWFLGHWGFQTAMEQRGASPLDIETSPVRRGDVIVSPPPAPLSYGQVLRDVDPALIERRPSLTMPVGGLAATAMGGGFYSSSFGPWPVLWGPVMPLTVDVAVVIRGVDQ